MATFASMTGSPGLPSLQEQVSGTRPRGAGSLRSFAERTDNQRPVQTFAQLQQQGMARPAPPTAPQGQPYQRYGGSAQAGQTRAGMLGTLQQTLAQPTRFDTAAFQQIRAAQAANLDQEFTGQRQLLDEEMARRGISASSITSGRYGDLLGQQARAKATLDSELLREAAATQMQDRLGALGAGAQFADLAGSQDLQEFEANRVAQAAEFEQDFRSAGFTEDQRRAMGQEAFGAAQAEQQGDVQSQEMQLRQILGLGELTGQVGGQQTLAAQQQSEQRRQFDLQQQLQSQLGLGQLGLSTREVDLQAQRLQQEAALQGRSLSIEEARLEAQNQQFLSSLSAEQQQFAQSLEEQRAQRVQALGLDARTLDLRAAELQQQAGLEGRRLTLDEARNAAEIDFRTEQLAQSGTGLTIEQARLQAQQDQFLAQLEEERAGRLQQLGLSGRDLDLRAQQIMNQAALEGRSLDLTSARDQAEVGYRAQQLQQQASQFGQTLTFDQARQAAAEAMERDRMAFSREGLQEEQRQFGVTAGQVDLDRQLRDRLGTRSADTADRQVAADEKMANNQLLLQLTQALGSLSNADIQVLVSKITGTGTGTGTTPETRPTTPGTIPGQLSARGGWMWNGDSWIVNPFM